MHHVNPNSGRIALCCARPVKKRPVRVILQRFWINGIKTRMAVSTPVLITFTIYISAMVLIGFVAWRATKNFSDYILGGRSLGSVVTALSAGASDMSGWLLMGLPGAVYLSGLSESWIAIGLVTVAYLNC